MTTVDRAYETPQDELIDLRRKVKAYEENWVPRNRVTELEVQLEQEKLVSKDYSEQLHNQRNRIERLFSMLENALKK